MSEIKTPITPPTLDWTKAEQHLKAAKDKAMEFAGKKGCNPFMYIAEHITPLETKMSVSTERTSELHAKILALKLDAVPSVA